MAQGRAWAQLEGDQPQNEPPERQVGPRVGTWKAAQPNELYQGTTAAASLRHLLLWHGQRKVGGKTK